MAEAVLKELQAVNLFNLTGVVAVVTGGGTGIGLMITTTLIANGAESVYIVGPNQEDLDKVANNFNEAAMKTNKPGKIYGIQGDISLKSEAVRLADEIGKREKHVTVLFNNAGIHAGAFSDPTAPTAAAYRKAFLEDVSEDSFTRSINTNAVGPYWLTFAFLPLLERWEESPGGTRFAPQVIMTSSMNGWTKDPRTGGCSFPYLFSKSAIGHATASLAHELLPLGVRVNGIAPGIFATEMTAPGTMDARGLSRFAPGRTFKYAVPAARPAPPGVPGAGTNRDMGALVLCLVANWFVDGETVLIDGGTLLCSPSSY